MSTVYVAPEVAEVLALHTYVTEPGYQALPIREQLALQADTLLTAHQAGDGRVRMQIASWWPGAAGLSLTELLDADFTQAAAQQTVAREHGFSTWDTVDALGTTGLDLAFEEALTAMLEADIEALKGCLGKTPTLAQQRSKYGHGSTLLHYLAANGVESHRQKMPLNAPDQATLLIDHGASKSAVANMYGGGQTPHALASTSAHPRHAGISEVLNGVLSET